MIIPTLQFLILALCPFYIIRFHFPFLNLPTTFLEILLIIYFALVVFQVKKVSLEKLNNPFNFSIALILLASCISIFISPDKWGALGIFRAYFLEPVLFFYTLLLTQERKSLKFIFWGLVTALFWLSILSLVQKLTGQFSLAQHEITLGRVTGIYNSANALALFIGPIIFIILGIYFSSKKNLKTFLGFLVVLSSIVIILSQSRGGLIALILSLTIFVYGYLSLKYKLLKKIWFLLPLSITVVILFFFQQIFLIYGNPKIPIEDTTFSDTLQIRYNLWMGTINLLGDNPIFGSGLDGFRDIYGRFYRLTPSQELLQYPHNIFLNFWVELGLLGLVGFLTLTFLLFKKFLQHLFLSKQPLVGLGIISAFCFLIIHGLVDVPYFKNDLSLEFWVLVALFVFWLRDIDYEGA